VDFQIVKLVLIIVTIIAGLCILPRYKNIPAVNLTLLCFIIFQVVVRTWFDLLFLVGVAFILMGINIEYIKLFRRIQELEKK